MLNYIFAFFESTPVFYDYPNYIFRFYVRVSDKQRTIDKWYSMVDYLVNCLLWIERKGCNNEEVKFVQGLTNYLQTACSLSAI